MSNSITITGLSLVNKPKPNKGGNVILAYFDCDAHGFFLKGCALVRTPNKGLVAWPPNMLSNDGLRSIRISDDSMRHEMMMRAREAYRALGGTEAEWVGRCIPAFVDTTASPAV